MARKIQAPDWTLLIRNQNFLQTFFIRTPSPLSCVMMCLLLIKKKKKIPLALGTQKSSLGWLRLIEPIKLVNVLLLHDAHVHYPF